LLRGRGPFFSSVFMGSDDGNEGRRCLSTVPWRWRDTGERVHRAPTAPHAWYNADYDTRGVLKASDVSRSAWFVMLVEVNRGRVEQKCAVQAGWFSG